MWDEGTRVLQRISSPHMVCRHPHLYDSLAWVNSWLSLRLLQDELQEESHYHTFVDYFGKDISGIVVPQRVYTTAGQHDWVPHPNVTFEVNGRLGIRLRDALVMPIPDLSDRHGLPTLTTTGNAITLRIDVSFLLHHYILQDWLKPL